MAPQHTFRTGHSLLVELERTATELDLPDLSGVRRVPHRDRRDDTLVRALSVDLGAGPVTESVVRLVQDVVGPGRTAKRVAIWQLPDPEELDVLHVSVELVDVEVHACRIGGAARNSGGLPRRSVVATEDLRGFFNAGGLVGAGEIL